MTICWVIIPRHRPTIFFRLFARVLAGQRERLGILGDDYPTPDGTGERLYPHYRSERSAYSRDCKTAEQEFRPQYRHRQPTSVKRVITQFERHSNSQINASVEAKRPGDVATTLPAIGFLSKNSAIMCKTLLRMPWHHVCELRVEPSAER